MSIASQEAELTKRFGNDAEISIVRTYTEAKSAKVPQRPVFNEMLACIEAGEAEGIIAWAPDRLARNSVDGGRIIYMLDQGWLADLKFATYTFENNTQGKFMLQIAFAQSKHYSDNLSDVVRRGNRTKVEAGWWPNKAPVGYLNEQETRTISVDPVRFPLVRKLFDLALIGTRPTVIATIAREELGLRTPPRKRRGDRPLSPSFVYQVLRNPFYAGVIVWNGEAYPGKHKPMVSALEFDRVAALLSHRRRERPKSRSFPYTGIIRCGNCGLGITAEHKVNRYGSKYIYYHCTRRRVFPRCTEPAIQGGGLEQQILEFLTTLAIPLPVERLILEALKDNDQEEATLVKAKTVSLGNLVEQKRTEIAELTGLRVRSLIGDDEFTATRAGLEQERLKLEAQLARVSRPVEMFEPFEELISFSKWAVDWFQAAPDEEKRKILKIVCSNPTLKGKILSIQAAKPFATMKEFEEISLRWALTKDVQTKASRTVLKYSLIMKASEMIGEAECAALIKQVQALRLEYRRKLTQP